MPLRHRDIETITVLGIAERMGPVAFMIYAEHHLAAAQSAQLPDTRETTIFSPAGTFLTCRTVELALKAFLSLKGISMAQMADGPGAHNLERLLLQADNLALGEFAVLSQEQRS